ncbi:xylulokinase [Arthrobacter stackebrandtii]|uniref:Xylulose kinase n=1 Tax=Arthrobacter stackebrandtii TaxID=272161 RepID=A0ABS4YTL2_9MICC|nr:xylulokinase [Arthrobacter stackebrandtii]
MDSGTGATVREGKAAHPDGTEIDPRHWWDALQAAMHDAGGLADVSAVAVAGQQHGMVLLDSDGQVVRPALLWNDTRSAPSAEDLVAEVGAAELAARCGSVPVASLTITKVRWVRDNEPENAARVAAVALPHDWLSWRLRGFGPVGESPLGPDLDQLATDRSDASGTGYWSPAAGSYDLELFQLAFGRTAREAGSPRDGAVVLPRVAAPDESIGTVHPSLFNAAPDGVRLAAGAGDNAAGALGLGAAAGDVVVSVGTSGTVFAVAEAPGSDPTGTIAGFADASGAYLPIAVTLNAARVLGSVSTLLGVTFDEFADLALAAQPGSAGVVLVPYFEGERTPNLPDAKASFHGLSIASTTRENISRAAIEGMLCGLAGGLEAIVDSGVEAKRLLLIGGAVQNPAVQAVAGQVFDVPVVIPSPGEYVARGAAVQAAWMLAGSRPDWPLETAPAPASDHHPEILANYKAAAGR